MLKADWTLFRTLLLLLLTETRSMVLVVALINDNSLSKLRFTCNRAHTLIADRVSLDDSSSMLATNAFNVALLRLYNEASTLYKYIIN